MNAPTIPPATPTQIVHIVVMTAAVMALSFFGTLIAMQFVPSVHDDHIFEAFKTTGTSVVSFLFGILVNTRVNKTPQPEPDAPVPPAAT